MNYYQVVKWGIVMTVLMSLLSSCGEASPTPIILAPEPASTPIQATLPPAGLPRATDIPATATTGPVAAQPTGPTATGGTVTPEPSPTVEPINRPFLMRIDRISVITGRGTLLEGRVANGTLQGNGAIEILAPDNVINTTLLAILISNTIRDQVTVGDYAGILVAGVEATDLSPGMLLAAAGEYESYEDALLQLQ